MAPGVDGRSLALTVWKAGRDGVGGAGNACEIAKTHKFAFDRVLGAETSQVDVFAEVSQLVQSALDGHVWSHPRISGHR